MPYLVDGNNVMAQRVGWHRDKAGARRRLMQELSRLAKAEGLTIAVVFDGAPEDHFPDGSYFMGVRVFYARRGSDADTRIKEMVEASRERRTTHVVTSDRQLADYVRRCGANVVRAGKFRRRLDGVEKEAAEGAERQARDEMSDEEVRREMRYFGFAPEDEEG